MKRSRKRVRSSLSSKRKSRSTLFQRGTASSEGTGAHWTFLTNHAHVLVVLSRDPSLVLREVAVQVGITERAVQRIIADLELAGILERRRVGRCNHYEIQVDRPLRHATESHRTIGELLDLING